MWRFQVLHAFDGAPDGDDPTGALLRAPDGTFYGTTQYGGTADEGSIFSWRP